jgi:hypothetical protein
MSAGVLRAAAAVERRWWAWSAWRHLQTGSAVGNFNSTDEIWQLRFAGMKSFTG